MAANKAVKAVGDDVAQTEVSQQTETVKSDIAQAYEALLAQTRTAKEGQGVPMADVRRMMYTVFDEAGDELAIAPLAKIVTALLMKEYEGDDEMVERLKHDAKGGNVYRKITAICKKPNKADGWKYEVGGGVVRRHH